MNASKPPHRQELVVVTGASTGIGAATARELARRGFHVLAGVRRDVDAEALRTDGIEPHILDITVESDVVAIADRVVRDPLRRPVRALINNAGISMNAPVETLPMAEWRRLFEVNLFGHIAMTQALLPALLRSAGTVVNISSVGGQLAMATYGPYAGTKFALEAVSDALRREVAELGIKVVVIEPGAVQTEMGERGLATTDRLSASMTPAQLQRYGDLTAAISAQARSHLKTGVTAEHAAKVIAKAATASRPHTRYAVGRDAAILVGLTRATPDRLLDRILRLGLRPHYVKNSQTLGAALRPVDFNRCRPNHAHMRYLQEGVASRRPSRRDSLKSSTDQRNMQPQAARSQTDCQSLRLLESCSWVNTRLLFGGPDGSKTRSVNGLVSRRQPVRRCRPTPLLAGGPPKAPSTPPNIPDRHNVVTTWCGLTFFGYTERTHNPRSAATTLGSASRGLCRSGGAGSTTESSSTPIAHVPTGWYSVCDQRLMCSVSAASSGIASGRLSARTFDLNGR